MSESIQGIKNLRMRAERDGANPAVEKVLNLQTQHLDMLDHLLNMNGETVLRFAGIDDPRVAQETANNISAYLLAITDGDTEAAKKVGKQIINAL